MRRSDWRKRGPHPEALLWLLICAGSLYALQARADCAGDGYAFRPFDGAPEYASAVLNVGITGYDNTAYVSVGLAGRPTIDFKVPR
ncbi:MAG: hypothetical protein ACJAYU_002685 [Bradymonadia bacterium]|jgi:hypothetical protein